MNTGGPAFPCVVMADGEPVRFDEGRQMSCPGMSLRDWFAGKALEGVYASDTHNSVSPEKAARWAYETADAMLAEREKGGAK